MKNQRRSSKIFAILLVFLLAVTLIVSCGASSNKDGMMNGADYVPDDYYTDKGNGSAGSSGSGEGIGNVPTGGIDNPSAKVIKTAYATVSTDKYDDFLTTLYSKITELSGYTDRETFSGRKDYRSASITVRVPAEKLEKFKEELSGIGTLTFYSAEKQDVSMTYATLVAKIDTLTLEVGVVEQLFDIAKADGDLARIAELEARLTDLRLQIAEAKAQLSVYDNSIAYSTVYLTVNESIERVAIPDVEEEKSAFERIGENLASGFRSVGNFFVELFVFLISAIPYLLVISLFASIPLIIIILSVRKKKKSGNSDNDDENSSRD